MTACTSSNGDFRRPNAPTRPRITSASRAEQAGGRDPLVSALAEQPPVFTPDTIGTPGRSVQKAMIRSAADLAVWLDDVLDQLGLNDVHLVGYSEGGWIAGVHAALTAMS